MATENIAGLLSTFEASPGNTLLNLPRVILYPSCFSVKIFTARCLLFAAVTCFGH